MFATGALLQPVHPLPTMVDLARQAEGAGVGEIWVADEGLVSRDVFVTMAAIAAATDTVRIGTGIVNPYTRHPGLIAAAIASIDELSGGRAFLTFGAGGSLALGALGIEREHPLARVREAMDACRRLLDGEVVTADTGSMKLRNARVGFARPGTEIWFAGRSPQLLTHAGGAADGVLLEYLHKGSLETYLGYVREGAARAGRPLPKWYYSTTIVTDPAGLDALRPHMTYRLVDSPAEVKARLGITPGDVAALREAMAGGLHAAAPLVPDRWIEPFVILGSPDECAAELHGLQRRLGFAGFVVVLADLAHAAEELAAGADVMDRLRWLVAADA